MNTRRMSAVRTALLLAALAAGGCHHGPPVIDDLAGGRTLELSATAAALEGRRVVLVGEHHTNARHHAYQLAVIQALDTAGVPVAVGMEMFRADSQAALDRWVAGDLTPNEFRRVYKDNWNYPYRLYRDIFEYVRSRGIPLVGLNIARGITRQVARKGFESLTDEQQGKLGDITCDVDDTYRQFVQDAHGAHAHGAMDFTHFCEAQLVWDTAMAVHIADYLAAHPQRVMVVIAGTGHVWKGGIPAQLTRRGAPAAAVILPATGTESASAHEAAHRTDYLIRTP